MNKRRQALKKQNIKTAKQKLQFGNGEKRRSSTIDFTNPLDIGRVMAQNKAALEDFKNMDVKMTNPWARENSIINTLDNNLSNVSNIDPAVLINRPSVEPAPNKPQGKPTKNPTVGINLNNSPNNGMNLSLGFNSNRGGKGFGVSTNTALNGPNNNIVKDSSVTVSGNRIPIKATLRGDGGFNVGLEGGLNDIFNSDAAQARRSQRKAKKKKNKKN